MNRHEIIAAYLIKLNPIFEDVRYDSIKSNQIKSECMWHYLNLLNNSLHLNWINFFDQIYDNSNKNVVKSFMYLIKFDCMCRSFNLFNNPFHLNRINFFENEL